MTHILIQNALLVDGRHVDILTEGNRIHTVGKVDASAYPDAEVIDSSRMAAIPGLINGHSHAAMTLFRGYGDDRELMDWLNNMIWPVEAHMTADDIYWGAKLACLEMIKGGTTTFLDMYTSPEATAQAAEDMGMRANISYTLFDQSDPNRAEIDRKRLDHYMEYFGRFSDRIQLSAGPHAIYTVCGEQLKYAHDFASSNDILVHLHLSETRTEWEESCRKYGMTPVRYLKSLGILSPRLVLAHCLWMDSEELQMLADYGCAVIHNPASNMKLASGCQFRFEEMLDKGIRVGIGTDGVSSSNNLDHFTAMKLASFLSKAWSGDPKAVSASTVYNAATRVGADILGINAGCIEEGALADLCLIDLSLPELTPCHNLISNLVYSANASCVDTTIIDGRILMRHRVVEGEDEIKAKAIEVGKELFRRSGREYYQ